MASKAKRSLSLWYARSWQLAYRSRNWIFKVRREHGGKVSVLLLLFLVVASGFLAPTLQSALEPYFAVQSRLDGFKTLLVTLGGALIGATAIAFSFIMFAMQVNVERMPHGLFRKFSSDIKLLGAFAVTFLLAMVITSLSLIPDKTWVVGAVVTAFWCSVLIIILFLLAYQRALTLISPTKQLALIVTDVKKNFEKWERAASRTAPIIRDNSGGGADDADILAKYDMDRLTYFQLHPGWTSVAEQAIAYCISFSRRYVEQGDHEVSQAALNGIIAINALYIKAKGRTFFPNNYLIDNPLASDGFLSNTLEHLRQSAQAGISRKDEQQIEQTFRAMAQLTQVYLGIDYGDEHATRSHAHLAAGYLSRAVESVVPHDMADVLIEGVTHMGNVAQLILQHKEPEHIATISEKIALIACTGAVNQHYQPVTQVAVMQLAKLTFGLMRSEVRNVRFALEEVRNDVKLIAEMYLKIPDTPLSSIHSTSLGPYYSGTSTDTLMSWLTDLANSISNADADDEAAQRVVSHIAQWSDGLYRSEKDLLLLVIDKQSHLAFDIIHWIVHITKLLLALSNADACSDYNRDELRNNAKWLIAVLSWVPDSEEAVRFVENYQVTENLFEAAVDAKQRGCDDVAIEVRDLLLSWAFKAGKYQTGWGVLERACSGLACLNIIFELNDVVIVGATQEQVGKDTSPSIELRRRAARGLREEAGKVRQAGYEIRAIESAMAQVDQRKLRTLLHQLADTLVPEDIPEADAGSQKDDN